MKKIKTALADVFLIEVMKFEDDRGYFMETWNAREFGLPDFVQDNFSYSKKGVLRGLHYQRLRKSQGKLVRCTEGTVYDVAVDLRQNSSTYSEWFGVYLNRPELQLWVPPGFAHGFYTVSDTATVQYKVTNYYDPISENVLLWNDPQLRIAWPFKNEPIMSKKDLLQAKTFLKCQKFLSDLEA